VFRRGIEAKKDGKVRLFQHMVKDVVIANTYELKQISLPGATRTRLTHALLCRTIETRVISGEQMVSPVTIPPKEIQDLRGLFSTYRLLKKQIVQLKNRIQRTKVRSCSRNSFAGLP
jgi:hypothetical protein